MEHLCSQVCHPHFCSHGGMVTYVFIWIWVFVCVCVWVTEAWWQRDSHVASWHFSSAMTHRDITPYQSHKHTHLHTHTLLHRQSFLNPPLLFFLSPYSFPFCLSFSPWFILLPIPLSFPPSLPPSLRLLFTNFLSFSPSPLSLSPLFFLSCSVASWQSAKECWYQLVDWALPTWRRAKKKKWERRQTERKKEGDTDK